VACPFHGFQFAADGRCTLVPANGRAAAPPQALHTQPLVLREAHDFVYAWYGAPQAAYPELAWFPAVNEAGAAWTTLVDPWHTHYSRAIENQLDVVHLPFVHHNTIGSGGRTLVNGPVSRWETPDLLSVWVDNETDLGQKARRESDLAIAGRRPQVQVLLPNLWHNWLGEVHLVAAFVPVDDEHTLMYVRTYQRFVTLSLLKPLVAVFTNLGNRVILNQDRRVVETQRPYRTQLKMAEVLIPGDGPIIAYRRRRQELIDAAQEQTV
jgi:phenylpropionate dioxygenase-like ring-hydroxylating dioxygenase large terminal subunit